MIRPRYITATRLHRGVQRRDRFIGNQESRPKRKRSSNHHALLLTAAELVWEAVQDGGLQDDRASQVPNPHLSLVPGSDSLGFERLQEGLSDRPVGIHGGGSILKDDLEFPPLPAQLYPRTPILGGFTTGSNLSSELSLWLPLLCWTLLHGFRHFHRMTDVPAEAMLDPVANTLDLRQPFDPSQKLRQVTLELRAGSRQNFVVGSGQV